jgi:hypothetical protein
MNDIWTKTRMSNRLATELREFGILAGYLYVCLTALSFLKGSILHAQGIAYEPWLFAAVKALFCAKFLMMGRALGFEEKYKSYPLIVPTLFSSFMFLVLLIALTIVEESVVGLIHRQSFEQSMANVGGGTFEQRIAISAILLLIFVPYFAFRALAEVLGAQSLIRMFFVRRDGGAESGGAAGVEG